MSTHLARRGAGCRGGSITHDQLDSCGFKWLIKTLCIYQGKLDVMPSDPWGCRVPVRPSPARAHAVDAPGDWHVLGRSIASVQRTASHGSSLHPIMMFKGASRLQRGPQRVDGLVTTAGSGLSGGRSWCELTLARRDKFLAAFLSNSARHSSSCHCISRM